MSLKLLGVGIPATSSLLSRIWHAAGMVQITKVSANAWGHYLAPTVMTAFVIGSFTTLATPARELKEIQKYY